MQANRCAQTAHSVSKKEKLFSYEIYYTQVPSLPILSCSLLLDYYVTHDVLMALFDFRT